VVFLRCWWYCWKNVWPSRRQILWLWDYFITQPSDYPRCKTKNRRYSIDGQCKDGTESLSVPISIYRWPILSLWMDMTMQPIDCANGKSINHLLFIDAPLTLTSMKYHQSLDAQQLYAQCIQSLLTATISPLCTISGIQTLRAFSLTWPPLYT